MFNYVIHIKKRKYAAGLYWQPLAVGNSPRSYARRLAGNVNQRYNLYTSFNSMVGVGVRQYGHAIGMGVAAVEIVNALSEYSSFLAAFKIEGGYYIVAVRNGIILSDKVFDTETQAKKEYESMMELPDWGVFFAPDSWKIPRGIERNLSELIVGNSRVVLHPINKLTSSVLPIVLLFIFLFFIYTYFKEPIDKMFESKDLSNVNPELVKEYEQQLEQKQKELDEQYDIHRNDTEQTLVMPYSLIPSAQDRAELCYKAIGFLMQPISGWNQVSVSCDENTVNAQFNRDFGTLMGFYDVARDLMPGAVVQEINSNTLSVTATLPKLQAVESLDERDAQTIMREVLSIFQEKKLKVDVNIVTDRISGGTESVNLDIVEVGAVSKLIPVEFIKAFEDFGGVYMTRCSWEPVQKNWNYEVIIYAK